MILKCFESKTHNKITGAAISNVGVRVHGTVQIESLPNMHSTMGVLPYTSERRTGGRKKKRGKEGDSGKERE